MARKKAVSTESKSNTFKFKGFINYTFSATEITNMLSYFDDRTFDHADTIAQWADTGFKIGFSYDDFKNCYACSATAKKTETDLDGWCVQFRHSDMHKLLCAIAYAINELYPNGGITPPDGSDEEFGW